MPNQSSLIGMPQQVGQDLNTSSSTITMPLGSYAETGDGRGFRYSLMGAVSSVPGKLYQSAAQDTTNLNPSGGLAVAAAAIGATQVTLTGSLTLAANLVAGGYMSVAVTPGQGYTYKVQGNTAVTSAANCVVTLADPIVIALTTSSKVVLAQHPYANVVVYPTTKTSMAVGVSNNIITNAQYGWLQTYGACSVLVDTAIAIGSGIIGSQAVAGAVKLSPSATGNDTLAVAMNAGVDTEYDLIYLKIH